MHKCFPKHLGGICLYNNFSFKIKACAVAPVFMHITGIAIYTAVLAARVRVHAVHHSQVGTIYFIDYAFYLLLYIFGSMILYFPVVNGFNLFLYLLIF